MKTGNKKLSIQELAQIHTPFEVVLPFENMKFSASRLNQFAPLPAMESFDVQNPIPASYLFIIRIVHSIGASTPFLIFEMLRYLNYKEKNDANREKRDRRCVPNFDLDEVRAALKILTRAGALYKFRFCCPNLEGEEGEGPKWYSIYKPSANGIRLYKKKLEDRELFYNETDAFMPPWEMFTKIHIGYMHNGFLPSPYLRKIQYSYVIYDGRKKAAVCPVRMVFNVNGRQAEDSQNDITVVLMSITYRVNTAMVTEANHYEHVRQDIERMIRGMDLERAERPAFLLLCCDEIGSLADTVMMIMEIDPQALNYILFTTGNILVHKLSTGEAKGISGCFIRFNAEMRKFKQVTARDKYLFLEIPKVGTFSYKIKKKQALKDEEQYDEFSEITEDETESAE